MFIENLAHADSEAIAHPTIYAPVVKDLIGYEQRQLQFVGTDGMVHLESVSITGRLRSIAPKAALELVAIAQRELTSLETQRNRKHEPVLPTFPVLERTYPDVHRVWCNRHVLAESESESNANTFVHHMTDITSDAKCSQEVEINGGGYRNGQLHVSPLLIIRLICLGRSASAE